MSTPSYETFSTEWPVAASGYHVVDGIVDPLPTGKAPHYYLPMERAELPAELAKVASGREADLLAFVNTYGLLGHVDALRPPFETHGAEQLGASSVDLRGEPVAWVLAHAGAVQLVSDLRVALDEPVTLRAVLDRLTLRDEAGGAAYLSVRRPQRGYTLPTLVHLPTLETPRATALRLITNLLNANLDGVARRLQVEVTPEPGALVLTSGFQPRNLLDGIYWHLADAVVGGKVRTCLGCRRFFIVTHERMRFCPLPMGLDGASRCLNRYKQKQHSAKRQQEEAETQMRWRASRATRTKSTPKKKVPTTVQSRTRKRRR